MEQQVNNIQESPIVTESEQKGPDFNSNDFFESLDREYNGGIFDDVIEDVAQQPLTQPGQVTQATDPESQEDGIDYKQRYGDSTTENQKLQEQLNEVDSVMPLINAMKADPKITTMVKDYLQNGGQPPKNIKEEMNLPENFRFDLDEVAENPNSDSSQVMQNMIGKVVEKKIEDAIKLQTEKVQTKSMEDKKESDIKAFREKFNMDDATWNKFNEDINKQVITYEDLYYLQNRGNASQEVARETTNSMLDQMQKVRNIPQSVAPMNGAVPNDQKTQDDLAFEAILNADSGVGNMFG